MVHSNRVNMDGCVRAKRYRGVAAPGRMPLAIVAILVFGLALLGSAVRSDAQSETVIKAFICPNGLGRDGCVPTGGVIARNGVLYGTTTNGGEGLGGGVVYALTQPSIAGGAWSEHVLYTFLGGADGSGPGGPLLGGANKLLYGVTGGGGATSNGTVFTLQPSTGNGVPWVKNELYSFSGGSDATRPQYGLIADASGTLYGATHGGGASTNCTVGIVVGCGAIFSLTPPAISGGPWTESVLYSFTGGTDGSGPSGPLVLGSDGTLYGETFFGGASGDGVVYAVTPPSIAGGAWTESVIHSFDGLDGLEPAGGLINVKGRLAGMTGNDINGFGKVFVLNPPATAGGAWTDTTLWTFSSSIGDGMTGNPVLADNGELFGTTFGTSFGGSTGDAGTVFQLTPPASSGGSWTQTILHSFTAGSTDGNSPNSGVIVGPGGAFYGTTFYGGGTDGQGTVYSVTP